MLWFSDNMLILLITIDVDTCGSCPDSSYDDGLDSCRECHPSCVTCDGPNSDDCIISASVTQTSTVLRTSSTSTSTSFSPSESKSTSSSSSESATSSIHLNYSQRIPHHSTSSRYITSACNFSISKLYIHPNLSKRL
mmetsp:Transcript_5547/g.6830  ORF Transcript_5547/g.6830 Transcript_5547/m.6830 type:complete len:137 (+) Transcript_5547:16-426(+)